SRIRFARNLVEYPFADRATKSDKLNIREETYQAMEEYESEGEWQRLDLEKLDKREKEVLSERRLISDELKGQEQGGLYFSADESKALMINEEDHLRLQTIRSGARLGEAFQICRDIERYLDEHLNFAFDDRWGYLTACPTNLGTGLRASALMHLPGLVLTQKINKVFNAISNLGLTVRGFYGEGSRSQGFYFQLSNQVTMGRTAKELYQSLQRVVSRVTEQEKNARKNLFSSQSLQLEDQIGRSYGILAHARQLQAEEALQLLSFCRLGVGSDFLPSTVGIKDLDGLLFLTQPAHLATSVGEELSEEEKNYYRAQKIRARFSPGSRAGNIKKMEDSEQQ
ncbi:MAG: ATP--guanido phosphotransferase, partial [bacterium]